MSPPERPTGLPLTFVAFTNRFPEIEAAHERVARAVEAAGPLDAKARELIKIGIAAGAGLESAVQSHVRRAKEKGASREEIEQAILLTMNTCGFPRMVAAWQWAQREIEPGS